MTDPTAARPGPSPRARIWIRLLVSPFLLALPLGVLWLHDRTGSPLGTDVLLALIGAAGALEFAVLLRRARHPVLPWLAFVGAGLVAGVGLLGPAPEDGALRMELRVVLLTLVVVAVLLARLRDTRPAAVGAIASTLLPVLYVGLLLSWLREVGPGPQQARWLAYVVLVAKASDMGGWLVGKPFGRHKMIPSVSPGKSWEGLAGGLLLSAAFALLLPGPLDLPAAAWGAAHLVLFGVAVGGASVLAGITWSGFKRRLGAKDSSTLLPEIGGIVDMADSMLLAAPVAWAWLRWIS